MLGFKRLRVLSALGGLRLLGHGGLRVLGL